MATGGERGGAVVQEATLPTLLFSHFYPCALRLPPPPPPLGINISGRGVEAVEII